MELTPAGQRNAVSVGMAVGLTMCGKTELPWGNTMVDLAFEEAWATWVYSFRFPRVTTDLRHGLDAVWAITHADKQKRLARHLYWEMEGGRLAVRARSSHDVTALDMNKVAAGIRGGVPTDAWRDLAADFLARLGS